VKIVDLSHSIHAEMPIYPGSEKPEIYRPYTIEKHGFNESKISLFSHIGTHMDAPFHILQEGRSLDRMPVEQFMGKAVVIDLSHTPQRRVDVGVIKRFEKNIENSDFLLLNAGWDRFWGTREYSRNYPVLTEDAASCLGGCRLKGVGGDMISVDETENETLPIHHILLESEINIIENLTNLSFLQEADVTFICMPLKLEHADGSPVRAVGVMA